MKDKITKEWAVAYGKQYEDLVCKKCTETIQTEVQKLRYRDLLRPRSIMNKSLKWVCKDCRRNIEKRIKGGKQR